jgi:hypothetical protein
LVETWLDRYTLKVAERVFPRARLVRYLPRQTYESMIPSVQVTLGERIQLVGYVLETESSVQSSGLCEPPQFLERVTLQPGERLYLTLIWQPLSQIADDYTVFSHLYSEDGRLWGQKDSQPVGGSYPTSRWQLGEAIVDRYEILLDAEAPGGEYLLTAGMYDLVTGDRLPVAGDDEFLMDQDRILLTTISVGP